MPPKEAQGGPNIIALSPYWSIIPAARDAPGPEAADSADPRRLLLAPGPGFGSGRHETTQLCLLAIGYLLRTGFRPRHVLDFGSGSGILALAVARAGARVEAVEIDDAACEHARRNAKLNGLSTSIEVRRELSAPPLPYDMVLANILRPVLLSFAAQLCERQNQSGHLVLSGLVSTDVPEILGTYCPRLPAMRPGIYERGEWRAVVFSPS